MLMKKKLRFIGVYLLSVMQQGSDNSLEKYKPSINKHRPHHIPIIQLNTDTHIYTQAVN